VRHRLAALKQRQKISEPYQNLDLFTYDDVKTVVSRHRMLLEGLHRDRKGLQ